MHTSHLVAALLAGVLVGAGVWIGATVWGGAVDEEPAVPIERPVEPAPAPAPTLGGRDADDQARAVAALEQRVAALEAALTEKTEQLEPMMKLLEQARTAGLLDEDGIPVSGAIPLPDADTIEMEVDASTGRGYAHGLGDTLGLDPSRKAALESAADGMFAKLEALEKEHASVDVEGDTTTITIGTYDGTPIERDWQDWVARNLTPDEQAKLQKEHAANRIFGGRLGAFERTIRIRESGGMVDIAENVKRDEGEVTQTQMQGPALAREFMLEPYAHLLE